jgi:hypothetical protein
VLSLSIFLELLFSSFPLAMGCSGSKGNDTLVVGKKGAAGQTGGDQYDYLFKLLLIGSSPLFWEGA